MKLRNFMICTAAAMALGCGAQQINPLTKAVLNGYQKILSENPKDYETLYERASQYYQLSMYDDAILDLVKAIEYTPAKNKDLQAKEYALLADVYVQTKDYDKALSAIDSALALSLDDYSLLYQKGNICLYLGEADTAYRSFASMQRLKSRSQEAYFGMARAEIMRGNDAEARKLIQQAEASDPSNYITYCRIGDLYQEMKEDENAAANYLRGFSLADNSTRPLESLIALADRNYGAVETALQYAIERTSNTAPLYFLSANIAYNSGNYNQAYNAFKKLIEFPDGRQGAVYATMAKCCKAIDKLDEAQELADKAVAQDENTATLLVKSDIELAKGNASSALLTATKALRENPNSTDAMIAVALANIALKDGEAAQTVLNEAIMTDPTDALPLMLRGYVNFELLKDAKQSVVDYTRAGNLDETSFPGIAYKALAQTLSGKKLDGDETMRKAMSNLENKTKDDYYWAAVYYSQTGNLEEARRMIQTALNLGYQDMFNLTRNNTANLTVAPIRHLMTM